MDPIDRVVQALCGRGRELPPLVESTYLRDIHDARAQLPTARLARRDPLAGEHLQLLEQLAHIDELVIVGDHASVLHGWPLSIPSTPIEVVAPMHVRLPAGAQRTRELVFIEARVVRIGLASGASVQVAALEDLLAGRLLTDTRSSIRARALASTIYARDYKPAEHPEDRVPVLDAAQTVVALQRWQQTA